MNYADWDGDGLYDHVQLPDGTWAAFDPRTGQIIESSVGVPASGENSTTGFGPDSDGGNAYGGFAEPGNPFAGPGTPVAEPPAPPVQLPAPPKNFGSGQAPSPRYANNTRHPFFGGPQPVPGGKWASQSSGGPRPVSNPETGASAGPNFTRAPRTPDVPNKGAKGGGGGGGGGGIAKDLYWTYANRIKDKLSGSGGGYSSDSYKPYKPETPRMRGFARRIDPEQATALYYRPSLLLPRVSNMPATSPYRQRLTDLPMAELAILTGGRKIAAPKRDDYGNLTKKDTSLSDFTNTLANMWDRVANRDQWFDRDRMIHNLMTSPKRSMLGSQFKGQPVGQQVNAFLNFSDAIFGTTYAPNIARTMQLYANTLADEYGAKFLNKKPKKAPSAARWIGKRLFYK